MTHDESIAKEIYSIIGAKLQLPGKIDPLFTHLELINDYNGAIINQQRKYIKTTATNHIDWVVTSHGWNDTVKSLNPDKPLAPMSEHSLYKVFVTTHNTIEGSATHKNLEKKMCFNYLCLLVEMMYAYVTCCSDIVCSICCLSKSSTCPSELHFNFLKGLVIYLKRTKHWGIRYYCQAPTQHTGLDPGCFKDEPLLLPDSYSIFQDHPTGPNPICFVDAAYANDLRKHRSTTGYAIMLAGGAIDWCSKTQSTTAVSSTETKSYTAGSAGKVSFFLHHVFNCLKQLPTGHTLIYEDNKACINVVNARYPTDLT